MKLSDMPTPETDALDFRAKDPSKAELANLCRSLERRLALAVAALESVAVDSQERFIRGVARAALAQVEEEK